MDQKSYDLSFICNWCRWKIQDSPNVGWGGGGHSLLFWPFPPPPPPNCMKLETTRLHSSRMHTAYFSGHHRAGKGCLPLVWRSVYITSPSPPPPGSPGSQTVTSQTPPLSTEWQTDVKKTLPCLAAFRFTDLFIHYGRSFVRFCVGKRLLYGYWIIMLMSRLNNTCPSLYRLQYIELPSPVFTVKLNCCLVNYLNMLMLMLFSLSFCCVPLLKVNLVECSLITIAGHFQGPVLDDNFCS